jgi:Holliday junction resolvase RusA-like endonuclease
MATQEASIHQVDPQRPTSSNGVGAVLSGSVCHLSFFIEGKPVAKARPFTTRTGHTFTPEKTVTWEQSIGWQVREQLARIASEGTQLPLPFLGRVIVDMRFNFDKPKGTPKGVTHKLKKPDYDNLAKSITDALQTIGVFKDDAQITDGFIKKRFSDDEHPQGVEIELTCWV